MKVLKQEISEICIHHFYQLRFKQFQRGGENRTDAFFFKDKHRNSTGEAEVIFL